MDEKSKLLLETYEEEKDSLYCELLALKYQYNLLCERLISANNRGLVHSASSPRSTEDGNNYIERKRINCNICDDRNNDLLSKLANRVSGDSLKFPKKNSVLYFFCGHLVHEKCQVRLINMSRTGEGGEEELDSSHLLHTCLTCLLT